MLKKAEKTFFQSKQSLKRLIFCVLTITLVFSLFPASAFGATISNSQVKDASEISQIDDESDSSAKNTNPSVNLGLTGLDNTTNNKNINTANSKVVPLQQGTGQQKVNFLPAFEEGELMEVLGDARFCDKDGNESEYEALNNANTMTNLKSAIYNKGITNVYLKGSPAIPFYGTYDISWDDAFGRKVYYDIPVYDYCDNFKNNLLNENLPISNVYNERTGNGGTNPSNWDAHDIKTMPSLNSIDYSNFEYAYSGLLSSEADKPWTSHCDFNEAWVPMLTDRNMNVNGISRRVEWIGWMRDCIRSVVLTQAF